VEAGAAALSLIKVIIERHILTNSDNLSSGNWRSLLPYLPKHLRHDIEYDEQFRCWTYTPFTALSADSIPLTIARAPVVIPVESRYPLMRVVPCPPDPCPKAIDPTTPLNSEIIRAIFTNFRDALGFYMLINGRLQIHIPENFDLEWALSHQPQIYGGLKVSYIYQTMIPTALESVSIVKSKSRKPAQPTLKPRLTFNHEIKVRLRDSITDESFAGRVGLKTSLKANSKVYLTIPTHLITNAMAAQKKHQSFFSKVNKNVQTYLRGEWMDKVDIIADNVKVLPRNPP